MHIVRKPTKYELLYGCYMVVVWLLYGCYMVVIYLLYNCYILGVCSLHKRNLARIFSDGRASYSLGRPCVPYFIIPQPSEKEPVFTASVKLHRRGNAFRMQAILRSTTPRATRSLRNSTAKVSDRRAFNIKLSRPRISSPEASTSGVSMPDGCVAMRVKSAS